MFREMRRIKQKLSAEESSLILERNTNGILAVHGDNGYPYTVPLSYVFDGNCIYFHSAKTGHKIDAVEKDPKASFCVIDKDMIVPEEYTTYFKSVIVFGKVSEITDDGEKFQAIEKLALKYAPNDTAENRISAINRDLKPLCMLKMGIEYISGKQAIELT